MIDGIDIRELNLFNLRQCIGWVSQDVFLFHGTVADNIRYGSFDATHEQIIQAAKQAEAHGFIEQLPQGYDTIVGERGQKLSGGQRQRLAIARATRQWQIGLYCSLSSTPDLEPAHLGVNRMICFRLTGTGWSQSATDGTGWQGRAAWGHVAS